MAGSRSWKKYTADDDTVYSVNIDEGNAEAAGFDDLTPADEIAGVIPPQLPKGFKMRYVNVRDPATGSTRQIPVGKPTNGLATGAIVSLLLWAFNSSNAVTAISWIVTSFVKEKYSSKRPNSNDTGFLDGDAS